MSDAFIILIIAQHHTFSISIMFRNILLLFVIAVFSCNNTTQKEQNISFSSPADCIKKISTTEEIKIREKINAAQKTARIDSVFQRKFRLERFNGNVLIAQQGVILYQKQFGYAQIQEKDTLVEDSKFQLASLSKTFTAVALLKLVEEGKVSLEDSVKKFFPQFPYSGIQIKSLLSHRSGLPNYAYVLTDSVRKRNPYPSNADILRWYCTVKPKLYNIPNRYFSYSNTNYSLLASIIEKVSGISFESFLNKNIFKPLGMNDTYLATAHNDSLNLHKTSGYQYNRKLTKDNFDDVVGDKGVYSTTGDIYKWYKGLNSGCLLRPETLKEAFTPRSFEKRGIKNYGYGFRMHVDEATSQAKYIYHTGWWKGYNTLMWFSPKDNFVIVILSNRYNKGIYQIKPLLEILEGRSQTEDVEKDMF